MSIRAFTLGLAALVLAVPASAQQRGTMEFGAFASAANFDEGLSLKSGVGAGGRIGMYLDSRWSAEFEEAEMRASRPNGLPNVNVGILSGRLISTVFRSGTMSMIAGGGVGVSTETNFMHTYGADLLLGGKYALSDNAAIRVDGVLDWLANQDWQSYRSVRIGFTFYRHPYPQIRLPSAPVSTKARADSSSAVAVGSSSSSIKQ
jgi:hypothetical protein